MHSTMTRQQTSRTCVPVRYTQPPSGYLPSTPANSPIPYNRAKPAPSPGANLTYVYTPAIRSMTPPPVLVFFHGGGYQDYSDQQQLTEILPQVAAVARIVIVVPSYSLDPAGTPQSPPVVVTAAQDGGCAVTWTERNIAAWGGDPSRITLAGDSAGASLAANVGLRSSYITTAGGSAGNPPIRAVAGLSGRYDFAQLQASFTSTARGSVSGFPPYKLEVTWPKWFAIHGSNNDPLSAAAPSPYRWQLSYEECDEDGAYGDAQEFEQAMQRAGNALQIVEDRDLFFSAGSRAAPYWHTPAHDAAEAHLKPYADPSPPGQHGPNHLYSSLVALVDGTILPTPQPSWEAVSTQAILPGWTAGSPNSAHWHVAAVGVRDVTVGADGAVWVVTNKRIPNTHDYYVAQYGNFGDGSVDDACLSVPQHDGALPRDFKGGGVRIAADASGFPWTIDADGALFALPGGLADDGYASRWVSEGDATDLASDVGAGAAGPGISTTFWTLGTPHARRYPVGSIWIAGRDRGEVSYRNFQTGGFAPAPVAMTGAKRIGIDALGNPYVVESGSDALAELDLSRPSNGWTAFSGKAGDVGVDVSLWRTEPDGTIARYVDGTWLDVPGRTGSNIGSGPTGIPWITAGHALASFH